MKSANLKNPFVQQYILELLIPFIGYFFFDWTLPMIAFFYLFDLTGSVFSFCYRVYISGKSQNLNWFGFALVGFTIGVIALVLLSFILMIFFSRNNQLFIGNIQEHLQNFMISEGWLLLPLVILMYYLKDQFNFRMQRKFIDFNLKKNTIIFFFQNVFIVLIVYLSSFLFEQNALIKAWLLLIYFVILKVSFDFVSSRIRKKYFTS